MKVNYSKLREIARQYRHDGLKRIFLHWSAGRYDNIESAYHISIGKHGDVHVMHPFTDRLAATWQHNTGSIAVSIMCCYDAVAYSRSNVDFGHEPPTDEQISAMAKVVCILCEELGFDMAIPDVMTHGEIADEDGYGLGGPDPDCRWDLMLLKDSDGELKAGGNVIRGMAVWFHYHPEAIGE